MRVGIIITNPLKDVHGRITSRFTHTIVFVIAETFL
jgi:hypothetical protein